MQLTLAGEPGWTNVIGLSEDLANWTAVTNVVNPTGTVRWTDIPPAGINRRFYRVLAL